MLRLKNLIVGRSKEAWIEQGVAEYSKRMSSTLLFTTEWVKDDAHLLQQIAKEGQVICLHPRGKIVTSEEFAKDLATFFEVGGSRLTVVIGGADGLPEVLLKGTYPLVSFSSMTFTHQMCRLLLAEQVYRSTEIWRGSPYHK